MGRRHRRRGGRAGPVAGLWTPHWPVLAAQALGTVALFLAGGPGGSELGTMARYGGLLERDFVVVTWDQRVSSRNPNASTS